MKRNRSVSVCLVSCLFVLSGLLTSSVVAGSNLSPEEELQNLKVQDGLQAQLFAAEPMIHSVSNIDIDARGRVWACEIINYRNNKGANRKEGDRILVLEDTSGDGQADEKTVFYQGNDINSPHGVTVLDDPTSEEIRVIVSTATKQPGPHVAMFTDTDGDLKADNKEVLFTGISGGQHDHSIHAFTFSPDGRFYFNFGNVGNQLKGPDGNIVTDEKGNEIRTDGDPYRQGMVFRTTRDFSSVETLGWNFRNNWMVTVDSFGTMWQSDNDDDGNRGVRINYVMPYGNYGYKDEITGAGWRNERITMAEDIPTRHWYQNDPGVIPNLLQTGAGSPSGITVYEGKLLPKVFQGQMIHADAGAPQAVRAYPVRKNGAGYEATTVNILKKGNAGWFRPVDVKAAPDGSLIVADWHDPGVGGHNAGSLKTGRLFRIAPEGHDQYNPQKFDFSSVDGAIDALKNPNYATRYSAWASLTQLGQDAIPALKEVWNGSNPRHRARALWFLAKSPDTDGKKWVNKAIQDSNPDIRITGIRLARQIDANILDVVEQLADDSSRQVLRSCAISLNGIEGERANELWARLAEHHDGKDRWYLEALGIGARNLWKGRFNTLLNRVGSDWNTPAGRSIVWRSRAPKTSKFLGRIILNPNLSRDQLKRYFRAFHFQPDEHKQKVLEKLAFETSMEDEERQEFIRSEALKRVEGGN